MPEHDDGGLSLQVVLPPDHLAARPEEFEVASIYVEVPATTRSRLRRASG